MCRGGGRFRLCSPLREKNVTALTGVLAQATESAVLGKASAYANGFGRDGVESGWRCGSNLHRNLWFVLARMSSVSSHFGEKLEQVQSARCLNLIDSAPIRMVHFTQPEKTKGAGRTTAFRSFLDWRRYEKSQFIYGKASGPSK